MKLKIKFRESKERGEWSRHEKTAVTVWNRVSLILALIFIVCAAIGFRTSRIDLGDPVAESFVLWFLFCCAYPVLGLLGLAASLFGFADSAFMHFLTRDHQVIGLAIVNGATLIALYLAGRFLIFRYAGAATLRIVANFLIILSGWGFFQLALYTILVVWSTAGFLPMEPVLREDEPDRVILVSPEETAETAD